MSLYGFLNMVKVHWNILLLHSLEMFLFKCNHYGSYLNEWDCTISGQQGKKSLWVKLTISLETSATNAVKGFSTEENECSFVYPALYF